MMNKDKDVDALLSKRPVWGRADRMDTDIDRHEDGEQSYMGDGVRILERHRP
jgi:hypothetical protein